jgi:hypothetical protein
VTQIANADHLRASHIKPWKGSTDEEKLNGCNGLLLSPHVDQLFDGGWISFADNGDLLISHSLDLDVLHGWRIPTTLNVRPFSARQLWFLAHHRTRVFRGAPQALTVNAPRPSAARTATRVLLAIVSEDRADDASGLAARISLAALAGTWRAPSLPSAGESVSRGTDDAGFGPRFKGKPTVRIRCSSSSHRGSFTVQQYRPFGVPGVVIVDAIAMRSSAWHGPVSGGVLAQMPS